MPDKENFNGIVTVEYETGKGGQVMATLSADDITQSGQGYLNNSVVEMTTETFTKAAHPTDANKPQTYRPTDTAKTLNCFANSEARAEEVVVQNFKSNLAGGDTETAMVTGDHDSRSTDFTNLLTSKTPVAVDAFNATVNEATAQMLTGARADSVNNPCVAYRYAVRRITPVEGERLQGFADNWTRPCFTPEQVTDELCDRFVAIHRQWAEINGNADAKPKSRSAIRDWLMKISSADCPDGPRYKAVGNSMSVNVMSWIGQRIEQEDNRHKETHT